MASNYYDLVCCKAPQTASWKWRSINKIIIIIIIPADDVVGGLMNLGLDREVTAVSRSGDQCTLFSSEETD